MFDVNSSVVSVCVAPRPPMPCFSVFLTLLTSFSPQSAHPEELNHVPSINGMTLHHTFFGLQGIETQPRVVEEKEGMQEEAEEELASRATGLGDITDVIEVTTVHLHPHSCPC